LKGKSLAMIFEKPSTRTRISFEVGMTQLGGHALYLSPKDLQLGRGETEEDTGAVLSRYVDGIMGRTFKHSTLEKLSARATIPIINGLSDIAHPCQALTDVFTVLEHKGKTEGLELAYVGDAECNTGNSLLLACAAMGINFTACCPEGHECQKEFVDKVKDKIEYRVEHDPSKLKDMDVIYTDVWISMGMDDEKEERMKIFPPFQINQELVSRQKDDVIVMHCLPAHRGLEITDEVIDGPRSVVLDQAENRLHVQKGIMMRLMK